MEPGIERHDLDIDLFAFVGIELRYVCRDVEHGVHFVRIVVADLQRKLMFFGCDRGTKAQRHHQERGDQRAKHRGCPQTT
jgi:hypothetical protein